MNEKEMIEEMAQKIFNTCAWRFANPNDYKEICKDIAEDLIKLGYTKNKIPEGSVVLTETQYNMLLNNQSTVISIDEQLEKEFEYELKQARKETAKEIIKLIDEIEKNNPNGWIGALHTKQAIAKKYGVEE